MLWQKGAKAEDWVTRFTVGEDYRWDTLLLPYDIEATRAHAWGLAQIGILEAEELRQIETGLDALRAEAEEGRLRVRPEDEDCHTVIEMRLTERFGDVGKKIHTGRSRNDQVLTAVRMFLREMLRVCGARLAAVVRALAGIGADLAGALMPGYTHLQRAMPTTVGSWALGYAELMLSDLAALRDAHAQVNTSPLGTAAGYGAPYLPLPRAAVAERLGFGGLQQHVAAAQLSRGKLELHAVHAVAQVGATLNRLAADLVLFNTSEFGFVRLPAAFCTGSSIMPQKQNPDVLELVRAHHHRLLAEMNVLMTLPANLPSGYHRDLQLTKEAAMRAMLVGADMLSAMESLLPGLAFDRARLEAACTPELYATALALEQVQQGAPFRDAYRRAAEALASLSAPTPEEALAAYRVDGYPGRERPDLVRERLARESAWLEA